MKVVVSRKESEKMAKQLTAIDHGWMAMVFPLIVTMLMVLFLADQVGRLRHLMRPAITDFFCGVWERIRSSHA